MTTLAVGHRHHAELLPHVDALRAIADDLGSVPSPALGDRLEAELRFVDEQLIPHMEMAEGTVYPRLEQLLEDSRAMAPMRREHGAIRRLIGSARDLRPRMAAGLPIHDEFALRRILYRLFVMMRVHLYEEERYLGIVDRNADDPERAAIVAGMRHAPLEAL